MGKVLSINISSEKGVEKTKVEKANLITNWGIEGDAHAGQWTRQISIFPIEALEKVPPDKYQEVMDGGYTENITISGISLESLSIGTILRLGEVEVKILHIGKDVPKEYGRPYIVSREGRFGKVIKGGNIKIGDEVSIIIRTI